MNIKPVKAKKHLGQHFLMDANIAQKTAKSLLNNKDFDFVLEIGPGMGMLTQFLLEVHRDNLHVVELDAQSVVYLKQKHPDLENRIVHGDFLKLNLKTTFQKKNIAIVGNFPYNISSQILFKVLGNLEQIPQLVGMFQKEMAQRVTSKEGNKIYGILSVLVQAYYDVDYLFSIPPQVFSPPPKVTSAVIRITRKNKLPLCDKNILFQVVKTAFNQRRKTLRNTLKSILLPYQLEKIETFLSKRPEQLSVKDFIFIAQTFENKSYL